MDVDRQVEYWTKGPPEGLAAAESLVEKKHTGQGLLLTHWALEKTLKAHVVRTTRDVPPRTQSLVRMAGSKPSDEQERFLRSFDLYQLEGCYPDSQQLMIKSARAGEQLQKAAETAQWLKARLETR